MSGTPKQFADAAVRRGATNLKTTGRDILSADVVLVALHGVPHPLILDLKRQTRCRSSWVGSLSHVTMYHSASPME